MCLRQIRLRELLDSLDALKFPDSGLSLSDVCLDFLFPDPVSIDRAVKIAIVRLIMVFGVACSLRKANPELSESAGDFWSHVSGRMSQIFPTSRVKQADVKAIVDLFAGAAANRAGDEEPRYVTHQNKTVLAAVNPWMQLQLNPPIPQPKTSGEGPVSKKRRIIPDDGDSPSQANLQIAETSLESTQKSFENLQDTCKYLRQQCDWHEYCIGHLKKRCEKSAEECRVLEDRLDRERKRFVELNKASHREWHEKLELELARDHFKDLVQNQAGRLVNLVKMVCEHDRHPGIGIALGILRTAIKDMPREVKDMVRDKGGHFDLVVAISDLYDKDVMPQTKTMAEGILQDWLTRGQGERNGEVRSNGVVPRSEFYVCPLSKDYDQGKKTNSK